MAAKKQSNVEQKVKQKEAPVKKDASSKKTNDSNAKVVKAGDKVKIDYVGSFENGNVFDASERHGQPIEFLVGSGRVIPGFDKGVLGMRVGDEKNVLIEPKDGYGEKRQDLIKIITRDKLPADRVPQVGMVIVLGLSNGQEIPALITKINKDLITLDLNHPLAGKKLNFKIKVVGIE